MHASIQCSEARNEHGRPQGGAQDAPFLQGRRRASALLALLLVVVLTGSACGRVIRQPSNSTEETGTTASVTPSAAAASSEPARETPQATSGGEDTTPTPGTSENGNASIPDELLPEGLPWAVDDFSPPEGSAMSKGAWLYFLRETLDRELPATSTAFSFHEAFGFVAGPGAGSGEFEVDFHLLQGWYAPGSQGVYGPWGPEFQAIHLTVAERDGRLSLLSYAQGYEELDLQQPNTMSWLELAEAGLQAQYDQFVIQWDRAASKGLAAIPPVTTPIAAKEMLTFPDVFTAPAEAALQADVNGDGVPETIQVSYKEDFTVRLSIGDVWMDTWYDSPEGAYLVDLDTTDGRMEIALTDFGPSSDDLTTLYVLENGRIEVVGEVPGILFAGDGKGRISGMARSWQGPLLTWFFDIEYELDGNGRVAMMPTRWYASSVPVTLRRDLLLYAEPDMDAAGVGMPAGTVAVIDLSDVGEWFHLTAANGDGGWVRFHDQNNLLFPDGTLADQMEVFDGIVAAD